MIKKLRIGTIVSLILLGLWGCVKKKIDFNNMADQQWTPEIAIPLVNSSFTAQDILVKADKNGTISVGPDNFCTLIYKGRLFSLKGIDLVPLPTQQFTANYALSANDASAINALPSGQTLNLSFNNTLAFDPGNSNVKLDEVTYKTCSLKLNLTSSVKQASTLTIDIPSASKNGIPFSKSILLNAATSGNTTNIQTFDLAGYAVNMTNGGTTTNLFNINYSINLIKSGSNSSAGESISIDQEFSNQSFSLIKGDVGQQLLSPNLDTVAITLFQNVVNQTCDFRIKYGTIKFDIENSYGVPIQINNFQLRPFEANKNFTYPFINLPASYNSLTINTPTTIGATAQTLPQIIGGPNETSLNTTINEKPKNFIYTVQTKSNPNGVPSVSNRNFLSDSSKFTVDFELDLPLYGGAWDFVFQDTSKFDLGDNTTDKINNLTLRAYIKNGFPFDVYLNVDFVDQNYNVMQSLSPQTYADVIKSGVVANEVVIASTEKTTDFVLTKTQIDNLKNVKYVIVRGKGNTKDGQTNDIKIYADYRMDVKMGIKGELNVPFK